MADMILFHHAQGWTPGVEAFAGDLRAAGHQVTVPDLFEGANFDTVEEGVTHAQSIGFDTIMERGRLAAQELPSGLVYAGFSLGVMPAQMLAQNRPGARGAVFVSSCVPVSAFGAAWPADVPVQIHGMDSDPLFVDEGDLDAARELVASADLAELFLYPGSGHLFVDSSLETYDEQAATLVRRRVLEFLSLLD